MQKNAIKFQANQEAEFLKVKNQLRKIYDDNPTQVYSHNSSAVQAKSESSSNKNQKAPET